MSSLHTCSYDLRSLNTLALPCRAQNFVVLEDLTQLSALSALAKQFGALHVLGGGSNLLLPRALHQPVVHVQLKGIEQLESSAGDLDCIRVAAGENWHSWVTYALNQGWHGLENLALIPGSVGAAPVQNIGAYGVEIAQFIDSVEVWNLKSEQIETLAVTACNFTYRNSRFKRAPVVTELIIAVNFALPKLWQPILNYPDLQSLSERFSRDANSVTPQDVYDMICAIRKRKLPDPDVIANVGSFFQNPIVSTEQAIALKKQFPDLVSYAQSDGNTKLAAGWLIDQCGWKGKRLGPVGMHANQALVLVNPAGGDLTDVMALAQAVRNDINTKFGVMLQIEPVCWSEA
jgi:UDP-N-acetylmuramate dehydrogenase